jgi:cyclopropane fatty-acyl-phospholipid synthase-like methyltransferase
MIKKLIARVLPYRPIRVASAFWEKRHEEGAWDRISTMGELARYSLIVGYVHLLAASTILNVGCGEGILFERLCNSHYSRYLGLDLSSVATGRICDKNDDKHRFCRR